MKTLKNRLIIIGSTLPYSFPTDYIKQTCKILNAKNHVIVFLWGEALSLKEIIFDKKRLKIIKKDKQLTLFSPIHFLPFKRFEIIQNINLLFNVSLLKIYLIIKGLAKFTKILWIFNYKLYNLPKLFGKSYISLYDCVDFFSSLDKKINEEIKTKEKKLIKNVDFFFVNSLILKFLFKKYSAILVPQGFDVDTFEKFNKNSRKLNLKLPTDKPIVGFIGSVNYRLDFKLLTALAKKRPEWNFVFVGKRQKQESEDRLVNTEYWLNRLFDLANVYKIKNQPKSNLSKIISSFNVCLIPYNANIEFNKYCYPMKVFEYFYMGKPVVSTPIKSLFPLKPYIKIAKNEEEFSRVISEILRNGWPAKYAKKQKQLAIQNSWQEKINQILSSSPNLF